MSNMNKQNLKNNYEFRVKEQNEYAKMTQNHAKILEKEEAQLIERLQKTFQTERRMTELYNKISDDSPVKKKLAAQKQTSDMSQAQTEASPTKNEQIE